MNQIEVADLWHSAFKPWRRESGVSKVTMHGSFNDLPSNGLPLCLPGAGLKLWPQFECPETKYPRWIEKVLTMLQSHMFSYFFLCTQHVIQGQNDIPEAEVNALAKCLDFDAKKLRDFRRICAAPCAVRQRSCQEAHALRCQAQMRLWVAYEIL